MNHRFVLSKLLQRTCAVTLNNNNSSAELHTNALVWRCFYKQQKSPCDSDAMTTLMTAKWHSLPKRFYSKYTPPQHHPTTGLAPLTDDKAYDLILALNSAERLALKTALEKYEAVKLKEGFEVSRFGPIMKKKKRVPKPPKPQEFIIEILIIKIQLLWDDLCKGFVYAVHSICKLAATTWRTRFGRLSKVPPPLSNVDPTGSFCTFPEDWLRKKAEEKATPPSRRDVVKIFFVNAVPFVVFGFMDNFCMITAGDYIEHLVGSFMCISTMAAAGLGNTISDVLGIGTAFYVERFCAFMGLKPPDIGIIQMEMKESRRAANFGRIIGITIGCLLGMLPLLFIGNDTNHTPTPSPVTNQLDNV